MAIRPPCVAGSFYPQNADEIRDFCLPHLKKSAVLREAKAVILPHAGYVYSGETACRVLAKVKVPDLNLMIGPNHRAFGADFALFGEGEWATPLGPVKIDLALSEKIRQRSEEIELDQEAHASEHSLEVILPMLQLKNPACRIVPLIVGTLNYRRAEAAARSIGEALRDTPEKFLVVISNDMSHYEPDAITRRKDRYALEAIENLDTEALVSVVKEHRISMCGLIPVFMLLLMKETLGITKTKLVDYRTSLDATGDDNRVVGYAGFIFE